MQHKRLLQTSQQLQEQIATIQHQIHNAPDGHIVCCHGKTNCKWYHSDGHSKRYIPKAERSLAEQLALKKYNSYVLDELVQEKKALDAYLHWMPTEKKSEQLLLQPGYADLLATHFQPLSKELSDWTNCTYDQNPQHPEHLLHKTPAGHSVRSKSEAMIDSLLYTNKLPFRYECPLTLGGITIYPDFTIRHPITGKTYYWEHFGMMNDPTYSRHTISKLQFYISHGIIPSIDLITTYETSQTPLTTEMIHKIIDYYFLS